MEIERKKLRQLAPLDDPVANPAAPGREAEDAAGLDELRVRQLRAREMLVGETEGKDLEAYVKDRMLTTTLNKALDWARSNAMWPATFGLACCAIEMMSMVGARYDTARYGAEVFRASPRQADMLILSGRVSTKMAPVIRRIYDQMLEPKWVLAMGACSSSGGMFANYAVVQGADKFLPVDIHIPGCPPRPEALMHGILKLQRQIQGRPDLGWRERYAAAGTEEWARKPPGGEMTPHTGDAPSVGPPGTSGAPAEGRADA